jgi:hypothetical protein
VGEERFVRKLTRTDIDVQPGAVLGAEVNSVDGETDAPSLLVSDISAKAYLSVRSCDSTHICQQF